MRFKKEIGEIYRLKVPLESVYTSVFLIKTKCGIFLVDCATTDKDVDEWIIPALRDLAIEPSDIKYLIITHRHFDHVGGKNRLLEYNPDIEIIDSVKQLFNDIEIYPLKGHTADFIGLLDLRYGTLITGDGLQGAGIGRYRCSLEDKDGYLESIDKIKKDKRIDNVLFSHAYEPWYKDGVFGRTKVEKILEECKKYVN
jgi:glyoxylase-like metal-dependent hydrolase (beta-lactamase superfamily II)